MGKKALLILSPNEARIVSVKDYIDKIQYKKWSWQKFKKVDARKFQYIVSPRIPLTIDFSAIWGIEPQITAYDINLLKRISLIEEKKAKWYTKFVYIGLGAALGMAILYYLIKYNYIQIW